MAAQPGQRRRKRTCRRAAQLLTPIGTVKKVKLQILLRHQPRGEVVAVLANAGQRTQKRGCVKCQMHAAALQQHAWCFAPR